MAPRKQAKQAAAESTQVAAADGNVTPPKKRKAAAKSTAPKQVRQVKAQEAATVFSPKNLRSRQKDVAPKNDAENKSKKMFVNKQKEEKKTVEDDNTGEQVEKKTRGGGKSAVTKKAGIKTATAKPKAKAPVVKKKKDQVENGGNVGNGIVSDENPPKRATRRGKAADEENVAPAATKVRVIKKPRKRKTAETEAIAEADDEEPPETNDAKMIVDNKKSREKAKKTAKAAEKEKSKNSTKISKGKRNVEKEMKDVEKEEGISMNFALESVDENDTSIDKGNNVSHNENNEAEIKMEIKDDEENPNNLTAFERSATFVLFE